MSVLSLPRDGKLTQGSNMDVGMMQLLNARQRELSEWQGLIAQADSRFGLRRAYRPPGGRLWIMEVEWRG